MNLLDLAVKVGIQDNASKGIEKLASTAKSVASTAAKAVAVGTAAVSAGVVAIGTQALNSYKEYEQLVGGVDKLYGAASEKLQQYAENAYKTSGMSANEYMQTATEFSASLIKSLNGDVDAAAEITDVAMRAISDNVDTFGSDMESVSNAFKGLAKENYTMLDNLRLGYAGSQQGMLELINDSGVLGYTLTDTSQLAEVGFAKMVEAIQAVQEQQGIAGTTAKEAMTTIEGSIRMVTKSWENLLTAFGTGDASKIYEAASGIIDGIFGTINEETGKYEGGVIRNVVPVVGNIAKAITGALPKLAGAVASGLKEMLAAAFGIEPDADIATWVGKIGSAMYNGLVSYGSTLMQVGQYLANVFLAGFSNMSSYLETYGPTIKDNLVTTITDAFNGLLEALPGAIDGITEFLHGSGPTLLAGAAELFSNLIGGLTQNGPAILESLGNLLQTVFNDILNAITTYGPTILVGLGTLLINIVSYLVSHIPDLLMAAGQLIGTIATAIVQALPEIGTKLGEVLQTFLTWAANAVSPLLEKGREMIGGLLDGIKKKFDDVVAWVKDIPNKIKNALGDLGNLLLNAGKSIIDGLLSGIKSAFTGVQDFVGGIGDWIAEHKGPKEYDLGLLVPNGQWIMQSLERGLDKGMPDLLKKINDVTSEVESAMTMTGSVTMDATRTGSARPNITIYIDGTKVSAGNVLDIVDDLVNEATRYAGMNRGGAYAY